MIPGALQSPGRSAGGTVYIVSETFLRYTTDYRAIPHNSKCRYGERGAAAAGAVRKP